ncbi:MAG: IS4 family transposase, partial [Pseudomonadota bacterium]
LFLPSSASAERKRILRAYGAELDLTDPTEGTDGAIRAVRALVARRPRSYFYADQYNNPANPRAHYRTTAPEIWRQTRGRITHFVAGLGTSGTFVGAGRRLRELKPAVRLISMEPDGPMHGLEGLKHMETSIIPAIYDDAVADSRMYQDFAMVLIGQARALYAQEDFGMHLSRTVYAFDATTIDLCLSLFPWAEFRRTKAGIKLNTLLDLRGPIPAFIHVSKAKMHEVNALAELCFEAGAFYLLDRGFLDFGELHRIHRSHAYFIVRAKKNLQFTRRYSADVPDILGLRFDQTIVLNGFYSSAAYPDPLRRVGLIDPESSNKIVFLTNNFDLAASTIARLYKARWRVELFFKWIKQHLRIKAFYGTSENAVKTQLWTAIAVYVLVALIRKRVNTDKTLYEILQILSVSLLEKTPISKALTDFEDTTLETEDQNQLSLFT